MPLSMPPRKSRSKLPRLWFITDERLQGAEQQIIRTLPAGTGVVLRNYAQADRSAWAKQLVRLCRQYRLVVLIAGDDTLAWTSGADGVHWPDRMSGRPRRRLTRKMLVTAAAHGRCGLASAWRHRLDGVFLSPAFVTDSHLDGTPLGISRFGLLLRDAKVPVIALGGISQDRVRAIRSRKIHGIAAISGWQV